MSKIRSPSPSPTITLDAIKRPELYRSSSEDSIRVIQHAVLFPSSPHSGRIPYFRRTLEPDSELVRRQLAAIALQPLTFAEELAAKRKQLEIRAEKRKRDKATAEANSKDGGKTIPEITIVPASGKLTPVPSSPTKANTLKDKTKIKIPRPIKPVRQQREQPSKTTSNNNNKPTDVPRNSIKTSGSMNVLGNTAPLTPVLSPKHRTNDKK